jgi:hypothetical protein
MKRNLGIFIGMLLVLTSLGLAQPPYCAVDLFITPPGGVTHQDFTGTPLPPGFFGPGSDPFAGDVVFQGVPLNTTPSGVLGPTDAIVKRLDVANVPMVPSTDVVPIEIVALSLVSVAPITVTYYGGSWSELWSVNVHLSQSPQQQGSMTVNRSCSQGGSFTSTLPVQPLFVFQRVSPPPVNPPIVFDTHGYLPPIVFTTRNGHWLNYDPGFGIITSPGSLTVDHDGLPYTPEVPVCASDWFYPGLRWDPCGCPDSSGHFYPPNDPPVGPRKRLTEEESLLAAHGIIPAQEVQGDRDQDGIPDDADNCVDVSNPLQEDADNDGVGDICDNCLNAYNPAQTDANGNGVGDICENGWDMGDLQPCNYPTLVMNPAHLLSGIAWLGPGITGELAPNILNLDPFDDGVVFLGLPWRPCTWVSVTISVTAGSNYPAYAAQCGGVLYLNGWKDGNLDSDFCDVLCNGTAPEWIVQDVPVTPGVYTFSFLDPGVTNMGIYDGVFRFRLTHGPVGQFGFGLLDNVACPNMVCGTFAFDMLGEVEDYIIEDMQLSVELRSFDAIPGNGEATLRWETASETDNDHFYLIRSTDNQNFGYVSTNILATNSPTGSSYSYVDGNLVNGTTYYYKLVDVDINGLENINSLVAEVTPTLNSNIAPDAYSLHQNYPNPFNPMTSISYDIREAGHVTLTVFDILGREVVTLVNDNQTAGSYSVEFNASTLSSGIYFYQLKVNNIQARLFSDLKKMVVLK